MQGLATWFFLHVLVRTWQSIRLVVSFATRRELARRLPWRYIRRRLRTDPVCIAAVASIMVSTVVFVALGTQGLFSADPPPWTINALLVGWTLAAAAIIGFQRPAS